MQTQEIIVFGVFGERAFEGGQGFLPGSLDGRVIVFYIKPDK
jgi:hypothetical protein